MAVAVMTPAMDATSVGALAVDARANVEAVVTATETLTTTTTAVVEAVMGAMEMVLSRAERLLLITMVVRPGRGVREEGIDYLIG